jgi:penicillin-binding protein 1A
LTLLEHASAFTTFPDDGVHIAPRMILKVTDYHGRVLDNFPPQVTDVLPAGVARLETSMLRQVFMSGTAMSARALAEQYPLAGKTGTTNNWTDAWFIGFSPSLTCGVWVGYDDDRSLGPGEEGSHVALPIWVDFMKAALSKQPVQHFPDSPLLTNPEQVQQILASAGPSWLPPTALPTAAGSFGPPQVNSAAPLPANANLPAPAPPTATTVPTAAPARQDTH